MIGVNDVRDKIIRKLKKRIKKYENVKKKLNVLMKKVEIHETKIAKARLNLENFEKTCPVENQNSPRLPLVNTSSLVKIQSFPVDATVSSLGEKVSPVINMDQPSPEHPKTISKAESDEPQNSSVTLDLSNFIEIGHIGTSESDRSIYLLRESCLNNSHYTISLSQLVGNGSSGNVYSGLYFPSGIPNSNQKKIVAKIFIDYGGARKKIPGVIFKTSENSDEYDKYDTDDEEIKCQLLAHKYFPEFVPRIFAIGHCNVFVKNPVDSSKIIASSSDQALGEDSVTVLVMEAGGITFTEWTLSVRENKNYSARDASYLIMVEMQKISNAYIALNSRGILHRDAKGHNIVKTAQPLRKLDPGSQIGWMIVDFGWSDIVAVKNNSMNYSHMDSFFFFFFTARYGKVLPTYIYKKNIALHYATILANGMLKYCLTSELFPDKASVLYSEFGLQLYIDDLEKYYDKFLPTSWRDDLAKHSN